MAKIYWTKEVQQLMDAKIARDSLAIINDTERSDMEIMDAIHDLRVCQKFAAAVIAEMDELDRQDEEAQARRREEEARRARDAEVLADG